MQLLNCWYKLSVSQFPCHHFNHRRNATRCWSTTVNYEKSKVLSVLSLVKLLLEILFATSLLLQISKIDILAVYNFTLQTTTHHTLGDMSRRLCYWSTTKKFPFSAREALFSIFKKKCHECRTSTNYL